MRSSVIRGSVLLAVACLIPACGGGSNEGGGSVTPPSLTITTPAGSQSGNVTVSYQLSDAESSACTIAVTYSIDGGATFQAAVPGPGGDGVAALTSSPGGTAHTFVWNSLANGVGLSAVTSALIRIVPSDSAPGTGATTTAFNVVNRLFTAPVATLTTPAGTQSGNITLNYSLVDAESDPCTIVASYSINGGASFLPATAGAGGDGVSGLAATPGGGTAHTFVWNSVADGVATGIVPTSVKFRITPADPAVGTPGTSNAFTVSNRPFTPPSITVTTPSGLQTGTIAIGYTLTDAENDLCSIVAEYSIDGGATFSPAAQGSGGDGIINLASSPGGTSHVFAWNSSANGVATGLANVSVKVRITPNDGSAGAAGTSGAFDVNNRPFTPPSAALLTPPGVSSGNVAISFTLFDAEGDACSVFVEVSLNGGATYAPATPGPGSGPLTGLSASPGGSVHGFVWNSFADGAGLPTPNSAVRLRLTPNDGVAGPQAVTADFSVDNTANTSGGSIGGGFPILVNGTAKADAARSIATDGAALYILGYDNLEYSDVPQSDLAWRVEKRDARTGGALPGFPLVFNPGPGFDLPVKILADGGSIFVVGLVESAAGSGSFTVQIRKFDAATGAAGFVVTGPAVASGDGIPLTWTAAVDDNALYIAGPEVVSATSSRWRVEKRDKTTGAPVGGFSAAGTSSGAIDGCFAMTLDATSMWLVGVQQADGGLSSNSKIRVEKRLLSTGALVPTFGTAGAVTIDAGPGDDIAEDVVRDGTWLYVYSRVETGFGTGVFSPRIDQLNPVSGGIGASLQASGAVDPTGELPARHLAIDGPWLYIACTDGAADPRWRIEKRSKVDFSLDPAFGSGGIRTINPSGGDDRPLDLLFLGGVLYIAGSDASTGGGRWRIEGLWR